MSVLTLLTIMSWLLYVAHHHIVCDALQNAPNRRKSACMHLPVLTLSQAYNHPWCSSIRSTLALRGPYLQCEGNLNRDLFVHLSLSCNTMTAAGQMPVLGLLHGAKYLHFVGVRLLQSPCQHVC
jgi:hypothetical protein